MAVAGFHEPEPAPRDPDKLQAQQQHDESAAASHHVAPAQPAPTADSPRPSQPPADDSVAPHGSQVTESQAQQPYPPRTGQMSCGQASACGSEEDVNARQQDLQLLRQHVARVTETAACLQGLDSDEAECQKVQALSAIVTPTLLHARPQQGRSLAL